MAYTIEEEQEINEIKTWWKDNYKSLILVVALALGGNLGWRYWQEHQVTKAQQLSAEYDQVIYSDTQDAAAKHAQIDAFVNTHDKSVYTVLALLEKAKLEVNNEDYVQAEATLKQALIQAPDEVFSSIIALRLATVQFQQKQLDQALASLDLVKEASWDSRKKLLLGDILSAKGDKEGAKNSYQQAQQNASALERQWLQVRLNNL